MSSLRDPSTGEDYPEAAKKHLGDAKALFDATCYDGAAYLIGYTVECCLKTLLQICNERMRTHDLDSLSAAALRLAKIAKPIPSKYLSKTPLSCIQYEKSFSIGKWSEAIRYQAPGAIDEHLCKQWIDDSKELFTSTVGELRKDGSI